VARAALDLLEPGEVANFLYGGVALDWPDGGRPGAFPESLWLLGVGRRLLLFAAGKQPTVLWRGDPTVHAEQSRQLLLTSCRLTGGEWLMKDPQPLAVRIPTGLVSSYASYFRPLLSMCGQPESEFSTGRAAQA
jgi:hypothetical protein